MSQNKGTQTAQIGAVTSPERHPWPKNATLTASVLVVAALLFFVAAYIIQLFPTIGTRLGSLASLIFTRKEHITITVDKESALLGEPFTVSYVHENVSGSGSYSFRYDCAPTLSLSRVFVREEAGDNAILPCDEWINVSPTDGKSDAEGAFTLKVQSVGETFTHLPIDVAYTMDKADTPSLQSGVVIVIVNEDTSESETPNTTEPEKISATEATPTGNHAETPVTDIGPQTSSSYPIGGNTSAPSGQTDLAVRILEIGIMDKLTGAFIATSTIGINDRAAVRFEIKNVGGRETGQWYFNAVLPTYPSHIFSSDIQQSLLPGARTEYTLGFDSITPTEPRIFTVNADPAGSIGEASETNNIASTTIEIVL